MSRPHIDFIHVDEIDWVELDLPGGNMKTKMKPLSRDDESGAVTAIVEFPAGFERKETGFYEVDEDIFYIDGEMMSGDHRFRSYCYTFHPAGELRQPVRSEDGATAIAFFSGMPQWIPADDHGAGFEPSRMVPFVDAFALPWDQPRLADFPAGAARKSLRLQEDPPVGVAINGLLPHWLSPLKEWHTFAEEVLILEGTIDTTYGKMTKGAYLSHPPDDIHGPMHSTDGCMFIVRTDGPFGNTYEPVDGYGLRD